MMAITFLLRSLPPSGPHPPSPCLLTSHMVSHHPPLMIDLPNTDGILNLVRNLSVNLGQALFYCVVDLQCIKFCYLESPLDCKEIQPVHPKRNQSWIFIGRTDAQAETPKLWPPDAKTWLIWKDPDAGKDWRQEKGMTEDEMVGWRHQLNGHECE